jgi:hypothetical protein
VYLTTEDKTFFEAEAGKAGVNSPRLSYTCRNDQITVTLRSKDFIVAQGELSHFPGCCGIAILHDAWATARRAAVLRLLFLVRERMAQRGDKGLVIYTDVDGDEPEFLRGLGYRTSTRSFYNPNSGNRVTVWTKHLKELDDAE